MRAHPLLGVVSAKKPPRSQRAFVDGAAQGNPGQASIGVVFQDADGAVIHSVSKAIGVSTNNEAEYLALILALQEALMNGVKELDIFADSELVVKQFNGDYRVKEPSLKILALLASHLRKGFKKVTLTHIPREKNQLADREANRALDQETLF